MLWSFQNVIEERYLRQVTAGEQRQAGIHFHLKKNRASNRSFVNYGRMTIPETAVGRSPKVAASMGEFSPVFSQAAFGCGRFWLSRCLRTRHALSGDQ
ncbi:MAG: hypothetical protein ACOY90_10845 [Candidatus Zhuqueibacterota bacterium]